MPKTSSSRKQTNKNIFTSPWKLNLQSSFCLCLHWAVVFLLSLLFFCIERVIYFFGEKSATSKANRNGTKKTNLFALVLKIISPFFQKLNIFLFVRHFILLLLLFFFFKSCCCYCCCCCCCCRTFWELDPNCFWLRFYFLSARIIDNCSARINLICSICLFN